MFRFCVAEARYGGAADRVFAPTAIYADALGTPDVVNLVHYDSEAALQRFLQDPEFLAIKPLRDASTRLLSFEGFLETEDPLADANCERVYGIEVVAYRHVSSAGYERYATEADAAMRPYGQHVDYTMRITGRPASEPAFAIVRSTSCPSADARVQFESDPSHARLEQELYPAAVQSSIWLDATLAPTSPNDARQHELMAS